MLISHQHQFVFVHVPKTGGDAVSQTLSEHCKCWVLRGTQKHFTAKRVRAGHFGDGRWPRYFSWGTVRNPWDQVHSDYWFCRAIDVRPSMLEQAPTWAKKCLAVQKMSFGKFCQQVADGTQGLWEHYLSDWNGNQLVTHVARYEQLEDEWRYVLQQIGLPYKPLRRVNVTQRRPPYRDDYDARSKDLVARRFRDDIKRFRYEF